MFNLLDSFIKNLLLSECFDWLLMWLFAGRFPLFIVCICCSIVRNTPNFGSADYSASVLYTKTIIHLRVDESGWYFPPLQWIIVNYVSKGQERLIRLQLCNLKNHQKQQQLVNGFLKLVAVKTLRKLFRYFHSTEHDWKR